MIKTYIPASVVKPDIFSCPLLALALGFRPVVRPYTIVRVRRTQVRLPCPLQGPDHDPAPNPNSKSKKFKCQKQSMEIPMMVTINLYMYV